ncbi:asparagine synthase (glutamine-hydrolyzing) [Vibrio anguillarum]|uniref:asparagine synthase (glutamine-hydrolyzing) n=2 Tax=Vibrio anguillarum TaxID=55601 RepID=UPI0009805FC6|nr:asparagine synthase (glutamine-hydrolyzing) [Vibrio anguillarum]AQP34957.1 asparagine synthase (glutamine-hydrolyzing) [Vibrio anguillarum]
MCGFSGFYSPQYSVKNSSELLTTMINEIIHRGPDDIGVWHSEDETIGFSHRRLAIVDLSPAGHQPMISSTARYILAFNGEIYNHLDLRKQLEQEVDCCWRGHSDTETLLKGFDVWGIKATIIKTIGMFAMSIWDAKEKSLTLLRDRLGEKPLYYGWQNDILLFGSELSSLKQHPSFSANIDRVALSLLIRQGYIPAPYSIYSGIEKLMPGTMLVFKKESHTPEKMVYWSVKDVIQSGSDTPFNGSKDDIVDELALKLGDAVERQMMADVPLGAFLSGGIDSSTIVALMQSRSSKSVKTFSIGFHEEGYNEADHAKAIAKHLGTDHTEYYATEEDALAVIPELASLYSEPFADSSQIPTYLVSKMAKKHVTVALSGDGGDELFSGYSRYKNTLDMWSKVSSIPLCVRPVLSSAIKKIPTILLDRLPIGNNVGDKMHKGADALGCQTFEDFYLNYLMAHTREPESIVIGGSDPKYINERLTDVTLPNDVLMTLIDHCSYLPDDILCKVDRAAMGVSLETRVPLLDHTIVEFAAKIPMKIKGFDNQAKWPLKQVLFKFVPRELIERPKKGFGIPLAKWLREGLKDWAEDLLCEDKIRKQGFFHVEVVTKLWREHQSEERNWSYLLWNILMFQAWYEKNHS